MFLSLIDDGLLESFYFFHYSWNFDFKFVKMSSKAKIHINSRLFNVKNKPTVVFTVYSIRKKTQTNKLLNHI